ncbi:putative methyltransferase FkbM family protein [Candidatus Hepatincolaceae symbiont of Richtersius coronifer]
MLPQNIYDNFVSYGFDEYIKTFQNYNFYNKSKMEQELEILQAQLDEASQQAVTDFLDLMLKLPLPSSNFLIKKSHLYTPNDLKKIKIEGEFYKQIQQYYKIYNLQGDEKLEVNIFKYHCGLKLLPKEIIKGLKDKVFIDGGAFWGDSALIINKYHPHSIICFEPNTVNYKKLQQTLENNNLMDKSKLINYGLTAKEQDAGNYEKELYYLSQRQNHGASFIFKAKKAKKEMVKLIALDDYIMQENKNQIVGLIKLDVEGMGVEAIKGAANIIKAYKPIISCAIYHNPQEFFKIKPLLTQYNEDYKFMIVALNSNFILKELTLLAY